MSGNSVEGRKLTCALVRIGICAIVLPMATPSLVAASCKVIHRPPPSEAQTALLKADYVKAAALYRAALVKNPDDLNSIAGLVHALLRQNKVIDAGTTLAGVPSSVSGSARVMTLRGEVELRQGEPWNAFKTAISANTLDPCDPQTMLLLSRIESLNSQYATSRKLLVKAHQIDPEDDDIQAEWIKSLPVEQQIPELQAYLAAPRGESQEKQRELETDLAHLKDWAAEPRKPCTMSAAAVKSEIPLVPILSNHNDQVVAFGLSVKINDRVTRLAIDTSYNPRLPMGGSGILISRTAARRAGLNPVFQDEVAGTGPQSPRSGFVGVADLVTIGDVELHNCPVQVMDVSFANGADGIVGLEPFSRDLITLDYPGKKLVLEPLPERPTAMVATDGLYNRYIAPSMKDYTPFYRSGSDIIVPLSVNGRQPKLFVLDTAVGISMTSPGAGYELATGHKDAKFETRNMRSIADETYTLHDVTLSFAGVSLSEALLPPFDTSRFTDDAGTEISGMVGERALGRTTIHIDYRDGLFRVDYDPTRKSPFSF